MPNNEWRNLGLLQRLDPQDKAPVPPLVNPLDPVSVIILRSGLRLAIDAGRAARLRADGQRIYDAIKPLLAMMVIFGLSPIRVRVNPPGGETGIQLELGEDISPFVEPESHEAAKNALNQPFDLPGIGTGPGLEVQFMAPELAYYAPRLLRGWQARADDPGSGLGSTTLNTEVGEVEALAWDLGGLAAADLGAMCDALFAEGTQTGPLRQFVDEALTEFGLEAQSRSDTHLYSLGFCGLIYDPDTWQHLFRWHESPSRREVRISTVRTVGTLVWRGVTGPDPANSSGPTQQGNAIDGPTRMVEFLREEIYGRPVPHPTDPGETVMQWVPLIERIEAGLSQARIEGDLIDSASLSEWETRRGKAEGLVRKIARILERDHEKINEFYDDEAGKEPPPRAAAIQQMTALGFIDLMIHSDFIRYEGSDMMQPAGTSMDGLEARCREIIPLQALVQEFPIYWDLDRDKARRVLMEIERDLLVIYGVLGGALDADTLTAPQLKTLMEMWRGGPPFLSYNNVPIEPEVATVMGFPASGNDPDCKPLQRFRALADLHNFRATLNQAGPVTEGTVLIRKAAGYARQFYLRTDEPSPDDVYETWVALGTAVVSADRFFYAGQDTKNVAMLVERFLEGFAEGALLSATEEEIAGRLPVGQTAQTTAAKLVDFYTLQLKSMPLQVTFPQFFYAGMAFGMGEYVVRNANSILGILADPYAFLSKTLEALQFMVDTPTGDLFFELGKGMGAAALKELDRLNTYTNPIGFVFQLGRLIGPFVLEELISLLFEAYVIVPMLNVAQNSIRRALKMGGTGYIDELARTTRLAPDFDADAGDLVSIRERLRAEGIEIEDFVDDELGDAFLDAPTESVTTLPDIDPYSRNVDAGLNLTERQWLRTLYEQWRRRLDYRMRDDLLDRIADAFPHLFIPGDRS